MAVIEINRFRLADGGGPQAFEATNHRAAAGYVADQLGYLGTSCGEGRGRSGECGVRVGGSTRQRSRSSGSTSSNRRAA